MKSSFTGFAGGGLWLKYPGLWFVPVLMNARSYLIQTQVNTNITTIEIQRNVDEISSIKEGEPVSKQVLGTTHVAETKMCCMYLWVYKLEL